jgi:hypothetical protein
MLGGILEMTGYAKAPKATFAIRHPVRTARLAKRRRTMENALTPTRLALGLGVLTAIPLGIWLGRRYLVERG